MRKLLALALVLITISAKAQFPSTDSLHRFNNRFIRTDVVPAFQNLRMNTLLHGIIQWIDSARAGEGGALGVDTLYALNDTTLRARKNGVSFDLPLLGIYDARRKVDTGYVYNDSIIRLVINGANRDFTVRGKDIRRLTDSTIKVGADTIQVGGTFSGGIAEVITKNPITKVGDSVAITYDATALDVKSNKLITRIPVLKKISELRQIPEADLDTGYVYKSKGAEFLYQPDDEDTPDDSVVNIRTDDDKLLQRIINGEIYVDWWKRPEDVDDAASFQRMFDWISAAADRTFKIKAAKTTYVINTQVNWPKLLPAGVNYSPFLEMDMPGVTIKTDSPIVVFDRIPVLGDNISGIIGSYKPLINGITFRGPSSTGSSAIKFGATYGAVIKNCHFQNFDTTVVLRFALNDLIENCYFTTPKSVAILGASGEQWGQGIAASAFNANTIRKCRIFNSLGGFAGIMLMGQDQTVIDETISEGLKARYEVYVDYQGNTSSLSLTINNFWAESYGDPNTVFYLRCSGVTTLRGIRTIVPDTLFHVPSTTSSTARYLIEDIPVAAYLAATPFNGDSHGLSGRTFQFRNFGDAATYLNPLLPSKWVGGVTPVVSVEGFGTLGKTLLTTSELTIGGAYNGSQYWNSRGGILFTQDNTFYFGGISTTKARPYRSYFGTGGIYNDTAARYYFGQPGTPIPDISILRDSAGRIGIKNFNDDYRGVKAGRSIFTERTGYSGYLSLESLGDWDFPTKDHLVTAVTDLQLLIESLPHDGISSVVADSTLEGTGIIGDSLRVKRSMFYTKHEVDSIADELIIGEGYLSEVNTTSLLTGDGTPGSLLDIDSTLLLQHTKDLIEITNTRLDIRIDSLIAAGGVAPDGSETHLESTGDIIVEGTGTASDKYRMTLAASLAEGNEFNVINVEDHGAVANLNTSTQRNLNTLAFRSAFAAALSRQVVLVPGGGKRFYLDDSVLLATSSKYVNWLQMGDVTFVQTSGKSGGYIVGDGSYHRFVATGEIDGGGTGATDSLSYSAYTRTGLYIRNCDKGRFWIQRIIGFHTGLKHGGESTTIPKGSQYNIIEGQQIKWNFIQVHVTTTSTTDGSAPGDKGNWSTSMTLRDFQLGGGTTPGIGGTIGILVKKMPSSNQANTNPFNYLVFDNIGYEGVYWGVIAENMDFSKFGGGGRIEEPAIQYPFYLSIDPTLGCYANDLSEVTGIYEKYFYQGASGFSTNLGITFTNAGTISTVVGGSSGSKYSGLSFNVPASHSSIFNIAYLDGLNGNDGERYWADVYRNNINFKVPFETKAVAASSSTSVATGVGKVFCTNTITITLPTASSWPGREITIKNIGSGTVTVTPVVSSNTASIAAHEAVTYIAYSGGWYAKDQKPASGGGGSSNWTVNGSDIYRSSKVGIGLTSPTARLHLAGGSATANTASLKLGEATNLNTTPEAGAIENYKGKVYYTDDALDRSAFVTEKTITQYGLGYLYSQISNVGLVLSTTQTSLLQGGEQTLTDLNMNAGDALILEGGIMASTPSPTTSTFTLSLYAQGNNVGGYIWSSGSTLLNQATVEYRIKIVPLATGTSVNANVITTVYEGSFPPVSDVTVISNFNTISPSINVTGQWSTLNGTHSVTSYQNTIERKRFQ